MATHDYSIVIVPEHSEPVRKYFVRARTFHFLKRFSVVVLAVTSILLVRYYFVVNQIVENGTLRKSGKRLEQQLEAINLKLDDFETKILHNASFAERLRKIAYHQDYEQVVNGLTDDLPAAEDNIVSLFYFAPSSNLSISKNSDESERIESRFESIRSKVFDLEKNVEDIFSLLTGQEKFLALIPNRRPAEGEIVLGFGVRVSPFDGQTRMHEGLDIANYPGTAIHATASGVVKFSGSKVGYGKTVVIKHKYNLETWYAHAQKILVKVDQRVRRGEQIALMGSTGRSSGPRVHYEVRAFGVPVDPLVYLFEENL